MILKQGQSAFHLSVFADKDANPSFAGTEALVVVLDKPLPNDDMQAIAYRQTVPATCFVWPAEQENCFNIRFFNAHNEIQLCGHGLLAAANLILKRLLAKAQAVEFVTQSSKIRTRMDHKQQVWIGFEAVEPVAAVIPEWCDSCCNSQPQAAATVGPDDGYWIFEWPEDFDLRELSVNSAALSAATNRALIVTTRTSAQEFDYDLRYFAPQHGVDEDKATGSANRVLACYWQQKLQQQQFRARQLSAGGAVMEAIYDTNQPTGKPTVWISGKVTIDA